MLTVSIHNLFLTNIFNFDLISLYIGFGNLYFSDYKNNRVVKYSPSSVWVTNGTIVAGTGVAGAGLNQLSSPWGIYVDESADDALYVADYANNRVMKWLPGATNGTIVAGGNGAGALYTQSYNPTFVFVDSFGSVYISELTNQRITRWLKGANNGTLVVGISGSAGATSQQLDNPGAFQFDTLGNLYVCSRAANHVQRLNIVNTSC